MNIPCNLFHTTLSIFFSGWLRLEEMMGEYRSHILYCTFFLLSRLVSNKTKQSHKDQQVCFCLNIFVFLCTLYVLHSRNLPLYTLTSYSLLTTPNHHTQPPNTLQVSIIPYMLSFIHVFIFTLIIHPLFQTLNSFSPFLFHSM